jgi:hypothetical protein
MVFRLKELESNDFLPLLERGPGVYLEKLETAGNSILSSVFIQSADPGATVDVAYYQVTAGTEELNERSPLAEHPTLTDASAPGTSKLLVTGIHNKPRVEVTVTGGNATFGVYGTLVTQFPVELQSFLQGHSVNLGQDKSIPGMIYDPDLNQFLFLTGSEGAQNVLADVMKKGRVREVQVNNTGWTQIPATSFSGRRVVAIQNESNSEVKINHEVSPDPGYIGVVIPTFEERIYTLDEGTFLYARAKNGTQTIIVEELSIKQ